MTPQLSNRLVMIGFVMGYCGVMGTLAALSFGPYGRIAITFVLLPAFVIGVALIGVGKLFYREAR